MKFKRIGLIMRLTTVILIVSLIQVSAAGLAQNFSMKAEKASLKQVFDQIRKQTGYTVLARTDQISKAGTVNIDMKNVLLADALKEILKDKDLGFSIEDRVIVIKKKASSLLDQASSVIGSSSAVISNATSVILNLFQDLRGRVVDENNNPLSGATITVKGTSKSTKTNAEGEFFLQNVEEGAVIVISFMGYKNVEFKAAKMMGTIKLEMGSSDLQEVTINKGYYTVKKDLNTGSVVKVTGDQINKQPVSNILQALKGLVPGLFIQEDSGVPGSSLRVQLRGQNSVSNDINRNAPLYIIDGVQFSSQSLSTTVFGTGPVGSFSPLNSINPLDIESIEVLKDADATALYGVRGANGVILITTKKGSSGDLNINLNLSSGLETSVRIPELMNTRQYLDMRYEAFKNDNVDWKNPNTFAPDLKSWDTTRYTNWAKIFLGGKGYRTNGQISISGGSDNTKFLVGGGYNRQTTIFPGEGRNSIISGLANLNHISSRKKFSINLALRYSVNNNDMPLAANPARDALLPPNAPSIYNEDGTFNWQNETWANPFAFLRARGIINNTSFGSNIAIDYNIHTDLKFNVNIGYSLDQMDQSAKNPLSAAPSTSASRFRYHYISNSKNASWIAEPTINYTKSFGKSSIESFVGLTFQQQSRSAISLRASDFPSDQLVDNPNAAVTKTISGFSDIFYRMNALRARIGYNWNDIYLLNITGSREGSTRFGEGRKFGNFIAIGTGWIFSNESFIKNNLPFISFGKLRGSWGITGNDKIGDYRYLSSYSTSSTVVPYFGLPALIPTRLANPDFAWEEVRKLEFGAELRFLSDRISVGANFYQHRTNNQLLDYSLSGVAGFPGVQVNLPAVLENSGIEYEVFGKVFDKSKIKWSTTINISLPKNKLINYPNLEGSIYADGYAIGLPINIVKRYHYLGVNPQTGSYQIADLNGDGQISRANDRNIYVIGVKYSGAITNELSYKSFRLNMVVNFVKRRAVLDDYDNLRAGVLNQSITMLDRWIKPGDVSRFAKYSQSETNGFFDFVSSDNRIQDLNFFRLQNVTLSYNLPANQLNKLGIKGITTNVSVQNLFTTSSIKDIDPEAGSYYSVPLLRTILFGLQFQF